MAGRLGPAAGVLAESVSSAQPVGAPVPGCLNLVGECCWAQRVFDSVPGPDSSSQWGDIGHAGCQAPVLLGNAQLELKGARGRLPSTARPSILPPSCRAFQVPCGPPVLNPTSPAQQS